MHKSVSLFLPDAYQENPDAFSWPVGRNAVVKVRDSFIKNIIDTSKNGKQDHHKLFPVLGLLWVNHVIQAYQILSACHAFKTSGITPKLDGDAGFMAAGMNEVSPPVPDYILLLESGVKTSHVVLENLRGIRRSFKDNPISYKPISLINFKKDCIINSTGELIFRHAKDRKTPLYYIPRDYWFKPISAHEAHRTYDCDEFINIVKNSFGVDSSLLTPAYESWLRNIYSRSMRACAIYLERLKAAPHKIPSHYWMGSGGVMWDRILKHAVTENGGTVTGHDHGNGIGHMKSISRALSECNDCDYFVSFSQNKNLFTDAIDHDFLFGGVPEVLTLGAQKKHMHATDLKTHSPQSIKKILVIPYGPDGNTARFIVTPHDSIKSDFLVRVLHKLKEWEYEVHLKPHPACPMPIEETYLKHNGILLHQGKIEDAFKETDAVLFLHHYTTTFREAFTHNMPLILIDPAYEEWVEDALRALKQRCSVIESTYDSRNRIVIDWHALREGIETSVSKNDVKYYETYYQ